MCYPARSSAKQLVVKLTGCVSLLSPPRPYRFASSPATAPPPLLPPPPPSSALQEPLKQQLLQYESGVVRQLPRLALCILQTPPEFVVYEAVVDLQQQSAGAPAAVVSWTKVRLQGLRGLLLLLLLLGLAVL